jgi:hypothetical protein
MGRAIFMLLHRHHIVTKKSLLLENWRTSRNNFEPNC